MNAHTMSKPTTKYYAVEYPVQGHWFRGGYSATRQEAEQFAKRYDEAIVVKLSRPTL